MYICAVNDSCAKKTLVLRIFCLKFNNCFGTNIEVRVAKGLPTYNFMVLSSWISSWENYVDYGFFLLVNSRTLHVYWNKERKKEMRYWEAEGIIGSWNLEKHIIMFMQRQNDPELSIHNFSINKKLSRVRHHMLRC